MWQLDRTTSGTNAEEIRRRRANETKRTNRLLLATMYKQALRWVPWEVVIAYMILLSLGRLQQSVSFVCFLVALNLLTVGFIRMCRQTIEHGLSRFSVVWTLSIAVVIGTVCLRVIPPGVSGRLDWFWTTISLAGIVAVPFFLVITGLIRLPRSFWLFASQQFAGFVAAASVLLVFLGAYGRKQDFFSTHSTIWQLTKSFGLLLVQGAKDLASGERIALGAKTTDVVEYVIGWIVFVLIAGVEVSIISNRASEELMRIEGSGHLHRPLSR